jgi:hypothetical protein
MKKIEGNPSLYERIEDAKKSHEWDFDKPALPALPALPSDLSNCNNLSNSVARSDSGALPGRYDEKKTKQDPSGPVPIQDPLTLDPDFSRAGLVVKLHSDLLSEDFFLVSDEDLRAQVMAENPGAVAYLPDEIERLAGIRPEEAKRLHMVKKAFPGEFVGAGSAADSIFNRRED